jgi:peptidoglycan/LPS O-acetylase OafA/YrhL
MLQRTRHETTSASAYRADIDGLRAIAVLSVVAYHIGATWLPRGVTGVDVFFVISGYVITAKLTREIAAGEFSLLAFYEGRFKRILPALSVMLAATLALGWFVLLPGDYAAAGKSAAYAAFGAGNLFFYWNTDYFDQVAELQPLLHTWSLGVEEQFYLVWPFVLAVIFKLSKRQVSTMSAIGLMTVIGVAYAIWLTNSNGKAAFYLPFPRAWELSIGALLVFLPPINSKLVSNIAAIAGAALVGWSLFYITSNDPFPGLNALYACVGSALVVWKKRQSVIGEVLSLRPLVGIGLISYSLYLWHWPVIVFYRHYDGGAVPSAPTALALGVASLVLSYLSYRVIEKPFRRLRVGAMKTVVAGLVSSAAIASAGFTVLNSDGFTNRLPPQAQAMSSLEVMWDWKCPHEQTFKGLALSKCVIGAPWETATKKAVLWGDSHAEHLAPYLDEVARANDTAILFAKETHGAGCSPIIDNVTVFRTVPEDPLYSARCAGERAIVLDWLKTNPDVKLVIVASTWPNLSRVFHGPGLAPSGDLSLVTGGLVGLIDAAESEGRVFSIVSDVPQWPVEPTQCALLNAIDPLRAACPMPHLASSYFAETQRAAAAAIDDVVKLRPEAFAVHPYKQMCRGPECVSLVNGEFIYRDSGHLRRNLTPEATRQLSELIGLPQIFR